MIIYGNVQGVFFRAYTKSVADFLGLMGWVKNKNSWVEIVAEGERNKLLELAEKCKKGPQLAVVKDVKVSWERATGEFGDFQIV